MNIMTHINRGRPPKKRHPKFAEWRGKHQGEICIVCGLGPSLHTLPIEFLSDFWTIGVNDILDPNYNFKINYLLESEDPTREMNEDWIKRKHRIILESNPEAIFATKKVNYKYHQPVILEIIDLRISSDIDDILKQNKIFAYRKVTTAAIGLAIYLGFTLIGVIGHDCQGDRAIIEKRDTLNMPESRLPEMNDYMKIIFIYCRKHDIKIFNLSQQTALDAFPTLSFPKFYKLAEKHYESRS